MGPGYRWGMHAAIDTALQVAITFSVLLPGKMWYAPTEPLDVRVAHPAPLVLMLTDFDGKTVDPAAAATVRDGVADLRRIFPALNQPGTYVLWAVPAGRAAKEFVGTPLVIGVRADRRPRAPEAAMVVRVEPLRYAVIETSAGPITVAMFYDSAPHTADNFLRLAAEGFYDGLTFHRVIEGFVIQGGDPRGDGTGGPGYTIPAEFSDRKHEAGVLSMARVGDPQEGPGVPPRPEFANSAGSQFFICLDDQRTRALDRSYTAFGKVVAGFDETVRKIAAGEIADRETGRPKEPVRITRVAVHAVSAERNPYLGLMAAFPKEPPATGPAAQ